MASIFTRIVNGEIPAYKVAEDDRFFAFLDISPLALGHTLVIPKKETDYIFDVENEEYTALWLFAKRVASAIRQAVPCTKVGVAVIGLEVAHAHIHLVPVNSVNDLNFSNPRLTLTTEEFSALAESIAARFR